MDLGYFKLESYSESGNFTFIYREGVNTLRGDAFYDDGEEGLQVASRVPEEYRSIDNLLVGFTLVIDPDEDYKVTQLMREMRLLSSLSEVFSIDAVRTSLMDDSYIILYFGVFVPIKQFLSILPRDLLVSLLLADHKVLRAATAEVLGRVSNV